VPLGSKRWQLGDIAHEECWVRRSFKHCLASKTNSRLLIAIKEALVNALVFSTVRAILCKCFNSSKWNCVPVIFHNGHYGHKNNLSSKSVERLVVQTHWTYSIKLSLSVIQNKDVFTKSSLLSFWTLSLQGCICIVTLLFVWLSMVLLLRLRRWGPLRYQYSGRQSSSDVRYSQFIEVANSKFVLTSLVDYQTSARTMSCNLTLQ
jgi:hypothetical protein